ncbi:MAG: glycosyltransferase family 4 protein [Bacteroidota bacterium]|nr:glycosyltransferase family 4 protein [Bacteroidota bacterium]
MSLIKSLLNAGFIIYILAPEDAFTERIPISDSLYFISVKKLKPKSICILSDWEYYKELKTYLRRIKPRVVLNFTIKPNIYGSFAAEKLKISCISTITGLGTAFMQNGFISAMAGKLYSRALKHNKYILFHNKDDRNYFIAKSLVLQISSGVVAGSGVDTDYFKAQPQISRDIFTFLFAGTIIKEKGVLEYIQAARIVIPEFSKVEFRVCGDVETSDSNMAVRIALKNAIHDKSIVYNGVSNDIRTTISECDVVVLPSYREGLPKIILEAMSMEKPVITTNVEGCRETIEHQKHGFIISPKSSTELAEAMRKMILMGEEKLICMGQQARKRVLEKFEVSLVNKKYENLIQDLI